MKLKKILPLIAFMFLTQGHITAKTSEDCYYVYKIKSNNEYYEIYASQENITYKIVSRKPDKKTKKLIRENKHEAIKIKPRKYYKFVLTSMREEAAEINGVKILPANYLDIVYVHPDNTIIKIDGGASDIHYARNLYGLRLLK